MPEKTWIEYIPTWAVFVLTVSAVLLALKAGYRFELYRRKSADRETAGPVGSVIGGTLGLLAFMLAFTFGIAAAKFDTRRELLLDEVNAIGTCYLRAGMVPDAQRVAIRDRLREYVRIRGELSDHPERLPQVLDRSDVLLDELWAQAELAVKQGGDSHVHALFVESLNAVIDFHTKRVVVGGYRIPGVIWLALYVVSLLSMAGVGYQFGLAGARDTTISLLLTLAFSIVIVLIADLDRSTEGTLRVSQRPMIELDLKLQKSPR